MAFEAFRTNGGPTYYESVKTPWEGDLITSGLIFCILILAFSFFLILPGVSGKDRIFTFIRIATSLFIGAVILVTNFAQTWETAEVSTRTKYKAGTGHDVNVTIGVNIGFRGVNITLKGEKNQIAGETIDYNEHFNWEGLQGRLGFGPFAGTFNQQYRAAQFRGLPLPILWVAEYFTFDGEGIRWGRHYRQAGWYAHIILWLAFPLWLLANILFFVLLRYGAYFLALTGLAMITSNIIWASYRNFIELVIPFTEHDTLEFSYGASFWICLVTGIICVVLGIVVFLLDKLAPNFIAVFFGVDVLQDSENIIVEEEEPTITDRRKASKTGNGAGPSNATDGGDTIGEDEDNDDDELYLPPPPMAQPTPTDRAAPYVVRPPIASKRSYRTAEHRITKRLQRPRRRDPPPVPPKGQANGALDDDDDGYYQNAPARKEEPPRTHGPPPPMRGNRNQNIGNRQSLAEDDLKEEQNRDIELTNFQGH